MELVPPLLSIHLFAITSVYTVGSKISSDSNYWHCWSVIHQAREPVVVVLK